MEEERLDPGHRQSRGVLRTIGPIVLAVGLILTAIGFISFFGALGGRGSPSYFWCAFLGLPLTFVGFVLCMFGYMGKVARYGAGEMAPVAKDTFNYMAEGTKDGIKTVAEALGSGLGAGLGAARPAGGEAKVRCHKCNELVDADAKFCGKCGAAVAKTKGCPGCGELNDPDAKFCDNCGHKFD